MYRFFGGGSTRIAEKRGILTSLLEDLAVVVTHSDKLEPHRRLIGCDQRLQFAGGLGRRITEAILKGFTGPQTL